jgi:hypothetical protein
VKPAVIIDTNVPVVANGRHPPASPDCVLACLHVLETVREDNILLLDNLFLILDQYRRNLSLSGQPGPGDFFMKWAWHNQANPAYCRQVSITPITSAMEDFNEFPRDVRLNTFDRDDKKFVAVALASATNPIIYNASDTDWWHYRAALEEYDLVLSFLCPVLME